MFKKKVLPFIIFIAVALAAGGLSALLSMDGMRDAASLLQPSYTPPAWLFPVVWTVLYILMGVSAALVWQKGADDPAARCKAIWAWAIQLFFNAMWSIIYFKLELRGLAFFWILALIALVFIMIVRFWRISKAAALLQIPYFAWLCFAARLNLAVWLLNR